MVNPINSDRPVAATTGRSGESAKNARSEQAAGSAPASLESQASNPVSNQVEVDGARQLYDLESQSSRVSAVEIASPEAARSLLDRILEQFNSQPEQALTAQSSRASSPLANLLQAAPV